MPWGRPPAESAGQLLAGKTFYVASACKLSKTQLEALIDAAGGTITNSLRRCSHAIGTIHQPEVRLLPLLASAPSLPGPPHPSSSRSSSPLRARREGRAPPSSELRCCPRTQDGINVSEEWVLSKLMDYAASGCSPSSASDDNAEEDSEEF